MTDLDEQTAGNSCTTTLSSPENRSQPAEPAVNGTPSAGEAASQPPSPEAERPAQDGQDHPSGSDRAEEVVDRVAHHVGYLAADGTRTLVSILSRTREAIQDFWAEVQDFRHGKKP